MLTLQPNTSPPAGPRDFEDGMPALLRGLGTRGTLIALAPILLLPAGIGARALLRTLPPPASDAFPAALASLALSLAVRQLVIEYRTGPIKDVDWTTAADHEHWLAERLDERARQALTDAKATIHNRIPAATAVHPYITQVPPDHEDVCTIHTGGCTCARTRLSAALIPSRTHPVVLIGEMLLPNPAQLEFVLAREAHHARWLSRTMHLCLGLPLAAGWLALGLSARPALLLVAVPALWLVTTLLRWGDELLADVAAVRATSRDAARWYWSEVREARPPRRGVAKALGIVGLVLASHPPVRVRAALAARIPTPT